MTQATIGIDISKDHLDAHRLPDGRGRRFSNDGKGCRALVKDRTAARNRQKTVRLPLVRRQLVQRLKQIDRQIQAVDAAIDHQIKHDPALRRRFEILISIPGISSTTAATSIVEMPEQGTLEAKQAASLAVLGPATRQSGTWRGSAHIRGGRADLRQALYMPALVAARFNPDLKAVYSRLSNAAKAPKVAITAVMLVTSGHIRRIGKAGFLNHLAPRSPSI